MANEEFLEQQESKINYESNYIAALNNKAPIPYITYILIAINVIIFAIMVSNEAGIMATSPAIAFTWGANFPPETIDNQWWRLITSAFIHYGIIHLLVNMATLYQAGEFVERVYGRTEFIVIYIFSAIFGGFGTLLFNTNAVSAGASGAIFGLIGAEIIYFLINHKEIPSEFYKKYFLNLSIFIGYNLFYGITHSTIDNWAHLGGALGGMIVVSPILVRSLFKEVSYKSRYLKIFASTVVSFVAIIALINPAVSASTPYTNVKNYKKEFSNFSKIETQLDSQYKIFAEALDKKPSPSSYSDFNNFLENSMIPELEKGKEKLSKFDTSSNVKFSEIQRETNIYIDQRIKLMSKMLSIMKESAQNKALKKEDSEKLDDLIEKFEIQSKKVTALFKDDDK